MKNGLYAIVVDDDDDDDDDDSNDGDDDEDGHSYDAVMIDFYVAAER
jgi:hypothetical protein